ncbi:hypothetical protein [Actinoplanes sp. NPDC051494]|uniref:hypothetical protein n=1 Tax=Actinoplanes sp. NPDC051494 TaxID=3363907 RepID=UPI00379BFCE0
MSGYYYDIIDASNELVRWWPGDQASDEEATAALDGVHLEVGEQVRVLRAATGAVFAMKPYGGVMEVPA